MSSETSSSTATASTTMSMAPTFVAIRKRAAFSALSDTNADMSSAFVGNHMLIARRVLMADTPGAAQLGAVWLPLPHILMLAFIWNNWAFYSRTPELLALKVNHFFTANDTH